MPHIVRNLTRFVIYEWFILVSIYSWDISLSIPVLCLFDNNISHKISLEDRHLRGIMQCMRCFYCNYDKADAYQILAHFVTLN